MAGLVGGPCDDCACGQTNHANGQCFTAANALALVMVVVMVHVLAAMMATVVTAVVTTTNLDDFFLIGALVNGTLILPCLSYSWYHQAACQYDGKDATCDFHWALRSNRTRFC